METERGPIFGDRLVSLALVDHRQGALTGEITLEILHEKFKDHARPMLGSAGPVGREDQVGGFPQRAIRGERLFFYHIETGAGNLAIL